MTIKNQNVESLLNILGIITIITVSTYLIKSIIRETQTNVVSNEAMKALQNREKTEKLRSMVDEYHKTGKWKESELESIL